MSDDISSESNPFQKRSPVPKLAKTAGLLWVLSGTLLLMEIVSWHVIIAQEPFSLGGVYRPWWEARDPHVLIFLIFTVPLGVCGVSFIRVGVRTIRGTAADTGYYGVGSIGLAACFAFMAWTIDRWGERNQWFEVVRALQSVKAIGFLAAGVLALLGRQSYHAWKRLADPGSPWSVSQKKGSESLRKL